MRASLDLLTALDDRLDLCEYSGFGVKALRLRSEHRDALRMALSAAGVRWSGEYAGYPVVMGDRSEIVVDGGRR